MSLGKQEAASRAASNNSVASEGDAESVASVATAQVLKSHPSPLTNARGHSYGINQQLPLYHTSYIFPPQVNPWAHQANNSQGPWGYNMPPDWSVPGGYTRILGSEVVTSVRSVETVMKPDDFLRLSAADRETIMNAGGRTPRNYGIGSLPPAALPPPPPPPPQPVLFPPPPRSKIGLSVKEISVVPSPPASIAGRSTSAASPVEDEKKCQLCDLHPRVPNIDGVRICSGCYQFHSYLLAEHATKQKSTK